MTKINNNVPIIAPITPTNTADSYPTHLDIYGKGGYRAISGLSGDQKEDIPVERRSWGMQVYEILSGTLITLVPPVPSNPADPANDLSDDTNWQNLYTPTSNHNSLLSLQGGNGINEFYHITANEHANAPYLQTITADPTVDTLVLRDANGRAKISDPVEDEDIVNKQYLDASVIPFDGGTASTLTSINVEDALLELESSIFAEVDTHNYLIGLQGGNVNEYYHLDASDYSLLTSSGNADDLHFHDADNIWFENDTLTSLTSETVQEAILELETLVSGSSFTAGDGIDISVGVVSLDVSNYTSSGDIAIENSSGYLYIRGGDVTLNSANSVYLTGSSIDLAGGGVYTTGLVSRIQTTTGSGNDGKFEATDSGPEIYVGTTQLFDGKSTGTTLSSVTDQDINITAAGTGTVKLNNIELGGVGAKVDLIETTLTNDDTNIPTSGAVFSAISEKHSIVSITNVDSPYTASFGELVLCDASSGDIVVNLPTSSSNDGKEVNIKKIDSSINEVDIIGYNSGTELIDGQPNQTLNNQYENLTLVSDGTNIVII